MTFTVVAKQEFVLEYTSMRKHSVLKSDKNSGYLEVDNS